MTRREQITSNIGGRLCLIKPGYVFTNPASRYARTCVSSLRTVAEWREIDLAADDAPALFYADGDAAVSTETPNGYHDRYLDIKVIGKVVDKTTMAAVRELMADANAAVLSDPTCGGYAINIRPQSPFESLAKNEDGRIVTGFQLLYSVQYRSAEGEM
jgi:hypothetical protein